MMLSYQELILVAVVAFVICFILIFLIRVVTSSGSKPDTRQSKDTVGVVLAEAAKNPEIESPKINTTGHKLIELQELRENNLITENEFLAKREEILNQL